MSPTIQSQPTKQQAVPVLEQKASSISANAPWILLAIVVVAAVVSVGFSFRDRLFAKADTSLSGYQAVFLTNGQVYFGKLSGAGSDYPTLTDIYYLQVNQAQSLQSGQQASALAAPASSSNPSLSLVKLGNELHGPVDLMRINKSQILFYEDLKASGKVAQAIVTYKQTGGAPTTATPATTDQSIPTTGTTGTTPAPTTATGAATVPPAAGLK